MKRALHHQGVGQGQFGLAESHATSFAEFDHVSEGVASELAGQGAERMKAGQAELFRSKTQHFNQAWFIENWVGVGRTDQAGDAAGHRCSHL